VSKRNVIDFLRTSAARPELLASLKVRGKAEVLKVAADLGMPFSEAEFDSLIWGLEARLAARRGEAFDNRFSLWTTMWGQYYLEYLVVDMVPSLAEPEIEAALHEGGA
jgi:hypothetical protein